MPSSAELPSLSELLRAFHASVGSEQKTEDSHLGSFYDRMAGIGALCMRTIAERDQTEARAIFFDSAADERLDEYTEGHFGDEGERDQDTFGTGVVTMSYPVPSLGDLIYRGTRFSATRGAGDAVRYWVATADVLVPAGATSALIPIQATVPGPAGQISIASGQGVSLAITDRAFGLIWSIARIDCGPGTTRQRDAEFRAAIRQGRKDARPGYPTAIIQAMTDAGAAVVALYQSDSLGDSKDFGLNRIYVGDAGYQSPPALLTACRLAIPKCAVAGTAVQVLPITTVSLFVQATVRLWQSPERLNQVQLQADATAAVVAYFARRDNAFLWSAAAIRAAIMKIVKGVHSIDVTASDSFGGSTVTEPDVSTMFDSSPLSRFVVDESTVSVSLAGPT